MLDVTLSSAIRQLLPMCCLGLVRPLLYWESAKLLLQGKGQKGKGHMAGSKVTGANRGMTLSQKIHGFGYNCSLCCMIKLCITVGAAPMQNTINCLYQLA